MPRTRTRPRPLPVPWLLLAATLALPALGCGRHDATAPVVGASAAGGGGVVERVDGPKARRLVAGGATLLDVRTQAEFAQGHVEGALNVPLGALEGRLGELPPGAPVVVYCRSGNRSAQAADILAEAGRHAYDLGPLTAW